MFRVALIAIGALTLAVGCSAPTIAVKAPAAVESIESQQAPAFTATDHRGQAITLADADEGTITALIFYRGAW